MDWHTQPCCSDVGLVSVLGTSVDCHALCGAHFTRCQWIPDPEVLIQTCVWEDSHLTFIASLKSSLQAETLMKSVSPNRLLKLLQWLYPVFFLLVGVALSKQQKSESWQKSRKGWVDSLPDIIKNICNIFADKSKKRGKVGTTGIFPDT